VEKLTLKELGVTEARLEEFVRKNIGVLLPDETLLIVGQQPKNKEGGRADLVAVDGHGDLVLIELKRDVEDARARREPFESQAIRYAASCAGISAPHDLVQGLFAPYVERHTGEYDTGELTASERASKDLTDFLRKNEAEASFNRRQRIVLIASSFDPQVLSAAAWLAKNGIDIRCLRLSPIRYGQQSFLEVEQVIPPPSLDQYVVEFAEHGGRRARRVTGEGLPRMAELFEWKIVAPGDRIWIRDHEAESAEMIDQMYVSFEDQKMKYNDWGRKVTGWSSINIYEWTCHGPTKRILDALRREKVVQTN